jgi:hypothetical protein
MPLPQSRPYQRWLATISILLAGVSGCGVPGQSAGDGGFQVRDLDRQRQQADDALARWADAVAAADERAAFVPLRGLTDVVGDRKTDVPPQAQQSVMSGKVLAATPLPRRAPAARAITWKDGSSTTVDLVSAAEALREIQAEGRAEGTGAGCAECPALGVTRARLGSIEVDTTRGPASVPAWMFTLDGTAARIVRVAVATPDRVVVTPPVWDPMNAPAGLSIDSATVSRDGRELTVDFIGAAGTGDQECGADYAAEFVESDQAVAVIIIESRRTGHGGGGVDVACNLIGAERSATATLAGPLNARAVLEVRQGLPVPVTTAGDRALAEQVLRGPRAARLARALDKLPRLGRSRS